MLKLLEKSCYEGIVFFL